MELKSGIAVNVISAFFLLLTGCSQTLAAGSDWLAPLDSKWKRQSPEKSYSITRVHAPSRNGQDSLRFELRKDEMWDSGDAKTYRAEISTKEFVPMGSEKWYGFSIFIPVDFPLEKNRLIISQWWARIQPGMNQEKRSPILQLRFAEGDLQVILRRYEDKPIKDPEKFVANTLYKAHAFALGKWNDFVFRIRWTPAVDGFIEAWLNGTQIVTYRGITDNDDENGPNFKFGLYRDATDKTYVSYVANYRMGDNFKAVDPSVTRP